MLRHSNYQKPSSIHVLGLASGLAFGLVFGLAFIAAGPLAASELRLTETAVPANLKTRCFRKLFCFHMLEIKSGVDYWLETLSARPMTFSLRAQQENMKGPVRTGAVVVAQSKTLHMARLRRKSPGAWEYYFKYTYHPGRPDTAKPDKQAVYELPFSPGHSARVTQGYNASYTHKKLEAYAIDWGLAEGTSIHAARSGVVVGADGSSMSRQRGRGNFIWIRHADGTYGWYLHLKPGGVLVKAGQKVNAGEHIGYSGNTGKSTRAHLHFHVSIPTSGRYAFKTIPIRLRTADGIVSIIRTGDVHRRR